MSVTLTVLRGPRAGFRTAIRPSATSVIGRLPGIELPLGDKNISRKHGSFFLSPTYSLSYTDHSTNGTAIRRRGTKDMVVIKQESVELSEGDHVLLGSTAIEVGEFPRSTRGEVEESKSAPRLRRYENTDELPDLYRPGTATQAAFVGSTSTEARAVYEHPFTQLAIARTGRAILQEAFN